MSTQRHDTFQKIQANHWESKSILLLTFGGVEDLPKVIGRDEPTKLRMKLNCTKSLRSYLVFLICVTRKPSMTSFFVDGDGARH